MKICWLVFKKDWFPLTLAVIGILLLLSSLAGCKKSKGNFADKSPRGMVINTASDARTAPLMAKLIYGAVPAEFQDRRTQVNLKELDYKPLAELRARDLLSPLPVPPYGIVGYWQGPDNNPDVQPGTFSNIYFVSHRSAQDMGHTVLHEWGHQTYWLTLNAGERAEWGFVASRIPEPKGYEGKGSNEAFAEYFALWVARKSDKSFTLPPDAITYFDKLQAVRK